MKKKTLEHFNDIKKDIELVARMAKRMQPDAQGDELKKVVLEEIKVDPRIQKDIQDFTAEHLVDIKIQVSGDDEVLVIPVDLSKNKIKLQNRGNGTEKVISATINDVPVLVKAQKDGKFEFSNQEMIEALESLVEILKTGKIQEVKGLVDDVTITGKEIAAFLDGDEPVDSDTVPGTDLADTEDDLEEDETFEADEVDGDKESDVVDAEEDEFLDELPKA